MIWQIILLIVHIISIFGQADINPTTLVYPQDWAIHYIVQDDMIYFQLVGVNKGSIALGLGGKSMNDIDVALFRYDNSQIVIEDRCNFQNPSKSDIQLDTQRKGTNDYNLDSSNSSYNPDTGLWDIIFHRKLITGDPNDLDLKKDDIIYFSLGLFSDFTWKMHYAAYQQQSRLTPANQIAQTVDIPNNNLPQSNYQNFNPNNQPNQNNNNNNNIPNHNQTNSTINNQNEKQICYQGICFNTQDKLNKTITALSNILSSNQSLVIIILLLNML